MTIFTDVYGNTHEANPEKISWRISVYALVVSPDNKVLMVQSKWREIFDLPGGRVEATESIAAGVTREFYEETGYSIELESHVPCYVGEDNFCSLKGEYLHSLILIYRARLLSEEQNLEIISQHETVKIEWISHDQITPETIHPNFYSLLNSLKSS